MLSDNTREPIRLLVIHSKTENSFSSLLTMKYSVCYLIFTDLSSPLLPDQIDMPYMALNTSLRKFHSKNNNNNNNKVTFRPYELYELAGKNTTSI